MNSPPKRPFRSRWWIQPPFWSESTIFSLRLAGASKLRISRYIKIHQDTYISRSDSTGNFSKLMFNSKKKKTNGGWSESGFCWFLPRLEVLLIEAKNLFPRSRDPRDPDPCGSLPALRKSCWSPIDMGVSWKRATPSHHPFLGGIFTNQPAIGVPRFMEIPTCHPRMSIFFLLAELAVATPLLRR